VESDATRMCELLVGLPDVIVLGVVDRPGPLVVHVESRGLARSCLGCERDGWVRARSKVTLVDLPCFGRATRLVWHKVRLSCPNELCEMVSWTVEDVRIASPRMVLTDRAGRWITEQVGRFGRTVNEVAIELDCDWHTVNDAVVAYGEALVDDDPGRIGTPTAVGLDETLFNRTGGYRTQSWSTAIVDVANPRLLDLVEGRDSPPACAWFAARGSGWCERIEWATLDLSGPYRKVFNTMVPDATQIADPFHVCKLANTMLDEVRRRVQNETLGHRGRKDEPLYRARRKLVMAAERHSDESKAKLLALLATGDPTGDVTTAWHAKEVVRGIYDRLDVETARAWVDEIIVDFADTSCPPEVRRLGRTIRTWREEIVAWHEAHLSNGPTEAINNLTKRIKRVAFGFRRFRHFRVRALLYAGRPNWALLATITPR
jgi:transposase